MRRTILSIGKTWAPVAGWMAVIFIFSTDRFAAPNTSSVFAPLLSWLIPGIETATIDRLHGLLRKLGHWTEYLILANLIAMAGNSQWPKQSDRKRLAATILVATLYAIGDEWHQSYVPSRTASAADVAIDACGAFAGAFWRWHRLRVNRTRHKAQQVGKKT